MAYDSTTPVAKSSVVEQAKKRLKYARDAWSQQRQREKDDLLFRIPENQWDADAKVARGGGQQSGVPARPMLTVPKIDQPIQLVQNQEGAADYGVTISPISHGADKETASVFNDIYLDIQRDSNADGVRSWAFARSLDCGLGYYRITTEYDPRGGDPSDQKIVIKRILDGSCVIFDPSAQEQDFCDAEYVFVEAWVPLARFKRLYPKAKATADKLAALGAGGAESQYPEWARQQADGQLAVYVVEYICKEYPEDNPDAEPKVCIYHIGPEDGEPLAAGEWNGKYLPIVPTVGVERQPVEGKRRYEGMVRPARDSQKAFNYSFSTAIELVALEPKAPYIGTPKQFEGYESFWAQANTRNYPYLPYNAVVEGQNLLPPPQRVQVDVSRLGPSMALLDIADKALQSSTFTFEASLGQLSQKERSGKAVQLLQNQSDAGNSHYLRNMKTISIPCEAKIILDAIPRVYDRPGRIAHLMNEENAQRQVMLNAPFTVGDDGQPQAVKVPPGAPLPAGAKLYSLKEGVYGVAVNIGKSYQTKLQQGSEAMSNLIGAAPELMLVIGDLFLENMDYPGSKVAAERMRKLIQSKSPELFKEEDGRVTPEMLRAENEQLKMQVQQQGQQLEAAAKALEMDQAKQQAMLEKAKLDSETKKELAVHDSETERKKQAAADATKRDIAELQAQVQLLIAQLKVTQQREQQAHDARMFERGAYQEDLQGEKQGMRDGMKQMRDLDAHERSESRQLEAQEQSQEREIEAGERSQAVEMAAAERQAEQQEREAGA